MQTTPVFVSYPFYYHLCSSLPPSVHLATDTVLEPEIAYSPLFRRETIFHTLSLVLIQLASKLSILVVRSLGDFTGDLF